MAHASVQSAWQGGQRAVAAVLLLLLLLVAALAYIPGLNPRLRARTSAAAKATRGVGLMGVGPLSAVNPLAPPFSWPSSLLRWAQWLVTQTLGPLWASLFDPQATPWEQPTSDSPSPEAAPGSGVQELRWEGQGRAPVGWGLCYDGAADGLGSPQQRATSPTATSSETPSGGTDIALRLGGSQMAAIATGAAAAAAAAAGAAGSGVAAAGHKGGGGTDGGPATTAAAAALELEPSQRLHGPRPAAAAAAAAAANPAAAAAAATATPVTASAAAAAAAAGNAAARRILAGGVQARGGAGAVDGAGAGAGGAGGGAQGGAHAESTEGGGRPPVIYIPALTGTELEAKLDDKPSAPRWWCARSTRGWFHLWLALRMALPGQFACYVDNLRLIPGAGPNPAQSPPGVSVRLGAPLGPQDGGSGPWSTVYGRLRALGWDEQALVRHAYDWRLSPASWRLPGGAFWLLRAQIEAAVAAAGGRRAVLLGLSMGGTYAAAFLGSDVVDEAWKAKHVEKLVTISGTWGGTPRAIWDLLSGRLEGYEALLGRESVRALLRGLPAFNWNLPSPDVFPAASAEEQSPGPRAERQGPAGSGGGGQPPLLVNTALGRSYGAADMGRALGDAGAHDAAAFWAASLPYITAPAPNVSTHCFYSYGLPTATHFTFSKPDFSDLPPDVRYSDGDVTVPYASLAACRGWAARQSAPVRSYSYYGVVHAQLTDTAEALDDIVAAIAGSD
ncbi:hypothetical protein HYH03_017170 [Edaphochlamys debaryana]|uniref:Uncharacterized protein n=1 Tax=Edaphochlamys debaryana TaxID=47281 RepID=A0A836BQV8_9CHLO|nr:hypothetical protein HYH03_017170 [Edaphochlamys debaryana]|eukprot:KAG2484003.1 hypothetical protein HYH03_017170 [Edaphochlamys debaryana]